LQPPGPLAIRDAPDHNRRMTNVACTCGAVFEVIETKGPSRETDSAVRCVVCKKELFHWSGSDVGQLRLIKTPEADRD
jgi:hypothetical protein